MICIDFGQERISFPRTQEGGVLQMSCDLIGESIQAQIENLPDVQMLLCTNHMSREKKNPDNNAPTPWEF